MNINLKTIEELKPCRSRLDNFVKHYKGFNGSMKQFLNLKNITHKDKLWVFFRLIPAKGATLVAAAMAEKVLHVFEKERPNDNRPRLAIEAARRGEPKAARAAAEDARAAAYAASAAHVAYYAAYAAYYALKAAPNQEKVQLNIMKKYTINKMKIIWQYFGYGYQVRLSKSSSGVWWSNINSKGKNRWRHDSIISIYRAYERDNKYYLYRLTVLKYTLGIGKLGK